ncbi:ComEA family DNA-binding protein [Skermania sp. ID1734]|uniref:ComEA family DNA-binding protein n=1 Tax=Skermania sp. ID1734 TaxID=2597516 RepID=UPI00117E4375|nr:ComEA family DNA-binding protein [Skermania sp. ID1734]TSE00032.1 ComEA family DNA-binding protein [Skermania sp. ID1734]
MGKTSAPDQLETTDAVGADSGRFADWIPERFRGARVDIGLRGVISLAAVGAVAAVLTGVVVLRGTPAPAPAPPLSAVSTAPTSSAAPAESGEIVVSVVGLVEHGGLVHLRPGARVADALAAAGGAKPGADLLALNLAQRLADGQQIVVAGPGSGPPAAAGAGGGSPESATPKGGGKVNLNTATVADLDGLPGVGPVTAAAIVAWRDANGRFTDVAQLGEVDGIGPARLARLRDLVAL